jgi:hypothetical protein
MDHGLIPRLEARRKDPNRLILTARHTVDYIAKDENRLRGILGSSSHGQGNEDWRD